MKNKIIIIVVISTILILAVVELLGKKRSIENYAHGKTVTVICNDKKIGSFYKFRGNVYQVVGDGVGAGSLSEYLTKGMKHGFNTKVCTSHITALQNNKLPGGTIPSLTNFNEMINDWDVSNVTTMAGLFVNDLSFNQNLDLWDVSNVIDMNWMFANAIVFNQNITMWNTSRVISMGRMFENAYSFNNANLNLNWDTVNVNNMMNMFKNARMFGNSTIQNLSKWKTPLIAKEPVEFKTGAGNNIVDPVWGD